MGLSAPLPCSQRIPVLNFDPGWLKDYIVWHPAISHLGRDIHAARFALQIWTIEAIQTAATTTASEIRREESMNDIVRMHDITASALREVRAILLHHSSATKEILSHCLVSIGKTN
jgi:hypothetical protein